MDAQGIQGEVLSQVGVRLGAISSQPMVHWLLRRAQGVQLFPSIPGS